MDDLKHKFLDFINIQGNTGKIPIVGSSNDDIDTGQNIGGNPSETSNTVKEDKEKDNQSDRDVLESIEPDYFKGEDFDPCGHELKKLPPVLDEKSLEKDLIQLKKQQMVVSNKVLQLILEKQTSCQEEFNRVIDVQKQLVETLDIVRQGREHLNTAKTNFTTASLGILANYRKRNVIRDLLRSLNTIKTLHCTEARLQELLTCGDFSGAISLLLECQSAAATFRHFTCVAALSGKLQDTLVMAEEQLDVALAKVCYQFEDSVYSKLQAAYALLGKTQIAMDQLHMHFTSAVHNTAFNVVHTYAQHDANKKQYSQLCKCVNEVDMIKCLVDLCKALWKIVLSYHHVVKWHHQQTSAQPSTDVGDFESNMHEQYVKQKLENGLNRLWHDVQTRVSGLVLTAQLTHFKFDEFLQVLAVLHRLEQVGEEFCGSQSEELQNSVKTQSANYFRRYHASRLDELRLFLENEVWTPCPVRSDFNLLHLQEFRGLRNSLQRCADAVTTPSRSSGGSQDGSSVGNGFFARYMTSGTPFDACPDMINTQDEDILIDVTEDPKYSSDESEDEDIGLQGPDTTVHNRSLTVKPKPDTACPLLTNTTLTVLRHCGKYLQMSRLLRSNATDVILCLSQLFEYYLYSIHSFFASDLPTFSPSGVASIKLQAVLKRIRDSLIQSPLEQENPVQKVPEPNISPVVDLTNVEALHGLAERIVAVESLAFLADQFNFLKPYLEQLQPQSHSLHQMYNQTVCVATDVRKPVYACVAWRSVDVKQAIIFMSRVNWEVKEVASEHSQYVDILLRELQIFSMRLEEIGRTVTITQLVLDSLWENIAHLISDIFVEGFASAKKCSNGGRGLMQLDFTQLVSQLERMCSLRPIPHRDFVEAYVKAYYHIEQALEDFIREHNVPEPNISPVVDLTNVEALHGLAERIVAVESLAFLADQFNFLKPYLEQLQPQSHSLHQMYNQTVCVATDVRKPVYACVAWRSVDVKQAIIFMSRVNWEVKEVASEHSQYVDILLRELQIFSMRLEEIGRTVTITQLVLDSLWENIAHLISDIFVEGFASAKKCSNGGRGLMQLDFTQLVSQLERMCSLRPIPHRDFVEAYVKAYYHIEQALEDFIREHNEYSSKQLLALVSCACQNNKKLKQRLSALIEELERTGAR